jgi:uncharacterized integral membrane protein
MQALRTIMWVLVAIVFVSFIAINWQSVPVNFWPLDNGNYLHFNWPVGFVAIVAFLLGWIPMWLIGRTTKWALNRRIATLENAVKAATPSPPLATSTQLNQAESSLAPTQPESPAQ